MPTKLKVKANDNTGRWEIHDSAGFLCDLESQSTARQLVKAFNAHNVLCDAFRDILRENAEDRAENLPLTHSRHSEALARRALKAAGQEI